MSEEERIKQRNLSWRERRRIISRVLFIVLSIDRGFRPLGTCGRIM